jgi:hypothetical protein
LAAFDRREGWAGVGVRSCALWLSWRCGISLRAGQDHLRVAHALERLPALREAFAAGRLSYSKARAIARVAEPDTDAEWVRQALHCTAGQLDRLVAAYARLHPPDPDDAGRRRDSRRLTWRWDDDGMLVARIVLPPEDGALFVKAVDAARAGLDDTTPVPDPDDETGPDAQAAEPPAPPRERALDADALVAVAAGFLSSGAPAALSDPTRYTVTVHIRDDVLAAAYTGTTAEGTGDHGLGDVTGHTANGGGDGADAVRDDHPTGTAAPGDDSDTGTATPEHDPTTDGRDGARSADAGSERSDHTAADRTGRRDPAPETTGGPDRQDPAADSAETAPGDARPPAFPDGPLAGVRCDVEPGVGLAPETVRRIACDAWLRALVVDRDGNPLDLGRRRRLATGRVRDAVYARDRGTCRYPGCGRTRWLDVHHLDHWAAHHGPTEPPNLVVLCGFHHRAVHEGGTTLHLSADGTVTAHLPDGRVLHPAPPVHAGPAPLAHLARATDRIHPQAATPDWAGDPLRLADSIHAIISQRSPADDHPARLQTVA